MARATGGNRVHHGPAMLKVGAGRTEKQRTPPLEILRGQHKRHKGWNIAPDHSRPAPTPPRGLVQPWLYLLAPLSLRSNTAFIVLQVCLVD
jgi:hypothetical protein